jgi:cyclophilin family peptidyl-prolyl cis-trans isomerase
MPRQRPHAAHLPGPCDPLEGHHAGARLQGPSLPAPMRSIRPQALLLLGAGCADGPDPGMEDRPVPLEASGVLLDATGEAAWGPALDAAGAPALLDAAELPLLTAQVERRAAPLVEGLRDPNPRVRARAALALASVQDEGARGPLEAALTDPDVLVGGYAAFALGQLAAEPGASDAPLLAVLGTSADPLRGEDEAPEEAPAPRDAAAPPPPESILRLRALEALGKAGGPVAVDALLDWTAPTPAESAARQLALGRLLLRGVAGEPERSARLAEAILDGVNAAELEVREASAWALSRSPDPAPWAHRVDALRERFDALEGDDPTALHLTTALGRLQDAEDLPRFVTRLESAPDWRLRTVAARAIGVRGWVPRGEVRDALHAALENDPSGHVRIAAATALAGLLPPERTEDLVQKVRGVETAPGRWREQAPFLPLLVEEGRGDVVVAWVRSLHGSAPRSGGRGSAEGTGSGRAQGLAAGLEALVASGDPGVTPLLLELTEDRDPATQGAAVRALVARWDRLDDADLGRVAERLAELALEGPLPAAVPAIRALGHPAFHGFGALPTLEQALEAAMSEPAGTPSGTLSGAPPGGPSRTPSEASAWGPAAARGLRVEALLLALGELGDPAVLGRLEAATGDPRPGVRRAAADALERLTGVRPRGLALPPVERPLDPAILEVLGPEPRWVLETEQGEVVIRLAPRLAPLTVQTVAQLSGDGAYDDTPFHRVIGNFVAQGGDVSLGDGTGTPGFAIRSEFTPLPFVRGVVGMASSGKDTEGAQFYLTHSPQPHLDGGYTAFGWVEEGGEVLDRILPGDLLLRARVEPTPQAGRQPGP